MSDVTSMSRPPRRWPLYLSLFLNMVLIAALAFGVWRVMHFRDGMMGGPIASWMPRQVERALPAASRPKVEAISAKHKDEFKPLFEASRTARENVNKALEAEPFNADQLRAALAAVRQADSAIAEATGTVMVEIASALTPEERKLVLEASRKRGPHGRKGRDGPGDGPPAADGGPMSGPPPGEPPPPPPAPQ